ncbi:hypothetical protein F2Q70_00000355 [Brassica cretica]|uniref:Uncharacterized protein n=1 Tax=Brassica cretica TaxID=69181 RepID=A0A8S9INI0_BRACR|nr:hypothetical protein F2Q70_00000355 [Brassica cretica]
MKSGKNGKTIKSLRISSSKQTNLIIEHGFSSAVRRAGPSWIDRNPSSPRPPNSSPEIASNSFLLRLDRRHLLYDLKTERTPSFSKNIRIDHIKRQRLAEHPRLPTLYEEFECSPELTSFQKHSCYKIIKAPKSENGLDRAITRQRAHL